MSELYPQLTLDGNNFRLTRSCKVLENLESQVAHYENVRKKYNRARSVFTQVGAATGFLSVVFSEGGLGTSLTGVGLPIGISLGALGGIFGIASIGCGLALKRLSIKVSKHEQTLALAKAKTNTVSGLVLKALNDNEISDKEFAMINAEKEKFNSLKRNIRQKYRKEEEEKTRHETTDIRHKNRVDAKTNSLNHKTRVISLSSEKTDSGKSFVIKLYKESW